MDNTKKIPPVGESWSDYRKTHYTAQEISENDLMVQLVGEVIKTRKEKHISQRELEDMTGIKQSVIARMESGKTDPQLSTVLKLLVSMGKTLSIVPLELSKKQKI
ncbi:MAG: helix-turn-helix domain-containing protein [Clostridiales bacterium]|nr:helix-turn-helix domain-containing protein [Clostridiales bacterium]